MKKLMKMKPIQYIGLTFFVLMVLYLWLKPEFLLTDNDDLDYGKALTYAIMISLGVGLLVWGLNKKKNMMNFGCGCL